MPTRLSHILAVIKDVQGRFQSAQNRAYHNAQKTGDGGPLTGLSRRYTPRDEEGDQLPSESKIVQTRVEDELAGVASVMVEFFNAILTREVGDTKAKASIVVDGQTLLTDVPVTYFLFLEKRLVDLHKEISKLPVLDPAERWHWDENAGAYATEPTQTTRTKKVLRNHVKAEAIPPSGNNPGIPAQVDTYNEDVVVGTWSTIKFSGCIPGDKRIRMLRRVEKLQEAVKLAREDANATVIEQQHAAKALVDYMFTE